jgi:hypothetical protein
VGLERGPFSLVRITEELFGWKSSGSGTRKPRLTAVGIRCADNATPSNPHKLALTSPICGGRSVRIVRLQTKATQFSFISRIIILVSNRDAALCLIKSSFFLDRSIQRE